MLAKEKKMLVKEKKMLIKEKKILVKEKKHEQKWLIENVSMNVQLVEIMQKCQCLVAKYISKK